MVPHSVKHISLGAALCQAHQSWCRTLKSVLVPQYISLGAALCQAHQSWCRTLLSTSVPLRSLHRGQRSSCVEVNGLHVHGLSCKLSSGKHSRHASINDIVYGACCRADIRAVKEPTGLTRAVGKRPDGSTLIP